MASIKKTKSSNKALFDIIRDLKKYSNDTKLDLFRKVAFEFSRVASQRSKVNVSKLNKVCKKNETIVCFKVLGDGNLSKPLNVVSFSISESAISKIKNSGGTYTKIRDFLSKKPKDNFRIIK